MSTAETEQTTATPTTEQGWYVDDRCLNCNIARQYAPGMITYAAGGEYGGISRVVRQPETEEEVRLMYRAAHACPTRSVHPPALQSAHGLTPTQAGLLTAPMALVPAVMAPFTGRLSDRVSAKYLLIAGLSGMASGLVLVALRTGSGTPPWQLLPGLLLTGLGMGLVLVPVNNVAMRTVRAELRGAASGVFFTGRQPGSVLGSAAVGVLLQARIAARVADAANTAAQRLSARYRADFATSLRGTAETSQAGGARIRLPDSHPAHLLPQAQDPAAQAVRAGLARAAADTLVLVIAVLLLGVPAAVGVPGRRPVPVDPDTA
ncbi:MFS transporter [Streptomyces sp. Ag109_G2-15]|uniref:MFS transporter n=1 Tax=Streptomyces sp. Ag109_G2-15 TaxID=1938850 RepID=UPI000BD46810|nr:MFS transporter [Streptomyces sp. Ag109_G2-15]SOD90822.1 4Fe-4S single cluster domain of Ferredoxin I [Streptomyces sp. Ag109_G2-15]